MATLRPVSHCTMPGLLIMWPVVRFVPPGAVCGGAGHWLTGTPLAQVRVPYPHSSWPVPPRASAFRASPSSAQLFTWAPPCWALPSVRGSWRSLSVLLVPSGQGKTCFLARATFPGLPPSALCPPPAFRSGFFFFLQTTPGRSPLLAALCFWINSLT